MQQNYRQAFDRFSQSTRRTLLLIVFYNLGVVGVQRTLLNLYLLRLGYGPAPVGLINSSYALAIALSSLPVGLLGGRVGARKLMLGGLTLQALAVAVLPLGEVLPYTLCLVRLALATAGAGLGNTLFLVNLTPYLVGVTKQNQRTHAFAARSIIDGIASVGGTVVAGALPALFGRQRHIPKAVAAIGIIGMNMQIPF